MTAAVYGITIEQYADFSRAFQVRSAGVELDITGYTFRAQIRERSQSTTATDFQVQIVDAVAGAIQMSMTDTVTAGIDPGDYVYDLVMTDTAGTDVRLLQGVATVTAGVTR